MEGEDKIIDDYFKNIKNGFYVDAGCYHPTHLSNTHILFTKNWSGINIDLSEFSISLFNHVRPNDLNINAAVSNTENEITFYYQKDLSQLTTTVKAISRERMQGNIKEKKIMALSLNSIINNSKFKNRVIDFLNIDLEGAELSALNSLDFNVYRPKLICIEIIDKNIINSSVFKFLNNLKYKLIWSSKSKINHIFEKIN
tara:strand:+ start:13419 stop:14015 length:597 start_codon:yes stop_codon:yes gene_type:complete